MMKSGHDHHQRADAAVWITIGVIAMAVMGFALFGPFELDWRSFLIPGVVTALLAAGGWFYRSVRHDERLAAILSSTAHIIGFAAVGAPLSYIAATAGFPLQDAALEAIDRHMGIDWAQLMTFVSLRGGLQLVLSLAYSSFALQTLTTMLALGMAGQLTRLSSFVAAFVATTLVIIAISAIYPAAGPWLFLKIQPASANGFLPTSSTQLAGFPCAARRHAAHRLRHTIRRNHNLSKSACGARRVVPASPLVGQGRALVGAGPERPAGDRHTGLWKPLRRRRYCRKS